MPDYDFYHGLYSGQQVDSAVARALVGGQLDQDIAAIRAAVGSPLVANTAAEMTNINKIYVYTGSEAGYATGHWYYYEGGSWQDGGLYNSAAADSAMSDSSTNAVQNKVIKAYVDTTADGLSGDIEDLRTDFETDILAEKTRAEGVEALKAPLASPALTGTPTAPTAAAGTANTQIATTAYADNAVAVEKARAEAVEATKADKSYADYILLREEEDRQILFGSIVEAAEDEYPELRSAPIHNAISIGGSVYPRMDRTRMAIDAIRGRTVAFNQLCSYGTSAISGGGVTFTPDGNGGWDFAGTPTETRSIIGTISLRKDHVYLVREQSVANTWALSYAQFYRMSAGYDGWRVVKSAMDNPEYFGLQFASTGTAVSGKVTPQCIDLTAMYGSTLADSIYAMEQAQAGAGVAYVRQRMDLDYYAANSGELKAPMVSGVSFVGFNAWDEVTEVGGISRSTGENTTVSNTLRTKNYIPVIPNSTFFINSKTAWQYIVGYGANKEFVSTVPYRTADVGYFLDIPANVHFVRFPLMAAYGLAYKHDLCVNLSKPTGTPKNGDYLPYQHTSLPLPSTRLDGVGTAQDVLFVREDGENDYSLILSNKADEDAFSALNWSYEADTQRFYAPISNLIKSDIDGAAQTRGLMCDADYEIIFSNGMANYTAMTNVISTLDKIIWQYTNNSGVPNLNVKDTRYTTVEAFVAAMGAKKIAYEVATPTETVIAEHLTLADISAIAENGGIVSIVNENGHIVQPDVVMDTVISRSAS